MSNKEFTPMKEDVKNIAEREDASWHVLFGSGFVFVTSKLE